MFQNLLVGTSGLTHLGVFCGGVPLDCGRSLLWFGAVSPLSAVHRVSVCVCAQRTRRRMLELAPHVF